MHASLFPYNVLSYASTVKHTDKETKETTELIKDAATNNKSAPQFFLYTFICFGSHDKICKVPINMLPMAKLQNKN